jgi:hypothetical protein
MFRSITIRFSQDVLDHCSEWTRSETPASIRDAIEGIRLRIPQLVVETMFPTIGALQVRIPDHLVPNLRNFLTQEKLGSFEIVEGHTFSGA